MVFCSYALIFICFLPAGKLLPNNDTESGNPNSNNILAVMTTESEPIFCTESSDFADVLRTTAFVDKTLMIETFIRTDNKIMITYPRGFGKSTILSMMKYFFAIQVDPETSQPITPITSSPNYKIFEGLKISERKTIVEKHLGKHPVIYLDFTKAESNVTSYEDAIKSARKVVKLAYLDHVYLLRSSKLQYYDKANIEARLSEDYNGSSIGLGVKLLSQYLKTHFSADCVVLVDGYDAMGMSALLRTSDEDCYNIFENVASLSIGILNVLLKDSDQVIFAIVMGTVRIWGAGGYRTKLNNIEVYNFFRITPYVDYFGLLETEFQYLLEKNNVSSDQIDKAKKFYKGYSYEGKNLYNTRSVLNYLKFLPNPPQPYFTDSESLLIFENILTNPCLEKDIHKLLFGGKVLQFVYRPFIDAFEGFPSQRITNVSSDIISVNRARSLYLSILSQQGYFIVDRESTLIPHINVINLEMESILLEELASTYNKNGRLHQDSIANIVNILKNLDFASYDSVNKSLVNLFIDLSRGIDHFFGHTDEPVLNDRIFRFYVRCMVEKAEPYEKLLEKNRSEVILLERRKAVQDGNAVVKEAIIIEPKYDEDVEKAFEQIIKRKHFEQYQNDRDRFIIIALTLKHVKEGYKLDMMFQVNTASLDRVKKVSFVPQKEKNILKIDNFKVIPET